MDELTFAELIDRARRGEADAAGRLVVRYEDAMRREVRFAILDDRLRGLIDETDVVQSVMGQFFLELWAGRFEFEGPDKLGAHLKGCGNCFWSG